jgi:heme oxygenase
MLRFGELTIISLVLSENMDPALQDLYKLVSSYKAFISSCNYLDFLSLAHIFSTALEAANNPIHRVLSSKVRLLPSVAIVLETHIAFVAFCNYHVICGR